MRKAILFVLLLNLVFSTALVAESYLWNFNPQKIVGFFWASQYEVKEEGFTPTDKIPSIEQRIKAEATKEFSAMIYGYQFEFIPNSKRYHMERALNLEPMGQIDPSKIRLKPLTQSDERGEFLCTYTPSPNELKRRAFWQQSRFSSSLGRGEVSLFKGFPARNEAVKKAVQNAIITLFKEKLANKPREIKGRLLFIEVPRIYLNEGKMVAEVKLLIQEDSVEAYLVP